MSDLIRALDRIMNWLEEHQPEYAASFLPGLSRQEIDKFINPLNIVFPEEIYELYQWRNGRRLEVFHSSVMTFPSIYHFLPLHKAVEKKNIEWINSSPMDGGFLTSEYENKILLPFLEGNKDMCAVVVSRKREKKYPVVELLIADNPSVCCWSITSMMLVFAEAYETGAYYFDEDKFIRADYNKILDMEEKYGIAYFID